MKRAMSNERWYALREGQDRLRANERRKAETRLANELQLAIPELGRGDALRNAREMLLETGCV